MSLEKEISRIIKEVVQPYFIAISDIITIGQEKQINSFHNLTTKVNKMSKANDQVLAIVGEMNEETNTLSARIDKFIADEAAKSDSTVTPEALAGLQGVSDRLKSLGADPAQPIPAPEPPVEEPVPVEPVPTDPNLPA